MVQRFGDENLRNKGAFDCAKRLYNEVGWRVFTRVGHPSLLSGIAAAVNLVLYDELQSRLFQNNVDVSW